MVVFAAEVSFTTESLAVIVPLVAALVSAIVYLFKIQQKTQETLLQLALYKELAAEAVDVTSVQADRELRRKGLPPRRPKAPVVPENMSPTTAKQQDTADAATLRAKLVQARLDLGFSARKPSPPEGSQNSGEDGNRVEVPDDPDDGPVLPPAVVTEIAKVVVKEVVEKVVETLPDPTADEVIKRLEEKKKEE